MGVLVDGHADCLDTVMKFETICSLEGAVCGSQDVTIRSMMDIAAWNISYELGSFWNENEELQSQCGEMLNDNWFYAESDDEPVGDSLLMVNDEEMNSKEDEPEVADWIHDHWNEWKLWNNSKDLNHS